MDFVANHHCGTPSPTSTASYRKTFEITRIPRSRPDSYWISEKSAKPGSNTLEIAVINPWNDRLTSISLNTIKLKSPLQSAGLLAAVTLQH
jgi:hypothetical protein